METINHNNSLRQQMTKEEFRVIWQSIHLKATDEYVIPPEILRVKGSAIGTLGNFSASTGKAKSKKTFNVSAIVAAALANKEVLCYAASFSTDKRKVLYIDTEQIPLPESDEAYSQTGGFADGSRVSQSSFRRHA